MLFGFLFFKSAIVCARTRANVRVFLTFALFSLPGRSALSYSACLGVF